MRRERGADDSAMRAHRVLCFGSGVAEWVLCLVGLADSDAEEEEEEAGGGGGGGGADEDRDSPSSESDGDMDE